MQRPKILILDDESSIRVALFRALEKKDFQVLTASSIAEASQFLTPENTFDIFLTDVRLPDGSGMDFMNKAKSMCPASQTILLTGYGTISDAVDATRRGAFHYVTKPFNIDEVLALVDKALEHKALRVENQTLKSSLIERYKFENIVGSSDEIKRVFELIERVADSDSTCLITGESGTGKELVAKSIHFNSSRSDKLMVPVNCGAIPGELLESELFGHVKGAFTGAVSNRVGRFELANHGSIFLDEIAEMSPHLQVKLLRVLQERKFEPVGSTKTIEVDVRIIAATNKDLDKAVADKSFREDLFYRLNVIPIRIPPLRERREDIPLLVTHFLTKFNESKKRSISGFSTDALELLLAYHWPGNVRELENLVERMVIMKSYGTIEVRDLPEKYLKAEVRADLDNFTLPTRGLDFNTAVDTFENNLIIQALQRTNWNRNKAAGLLNLNRTTLVEKIKKKGLLPPDRSA